MEDDHMQGRRKNNWQDSPTTGSIKADKAGSQQESAGEQAFFPLSRPYRI